jgi:GAF domain-containing protein
MQKYNQIAEFGKKLMGLTDMDNAIGLIAQEAKKLVNADRCSIFIADKEDQMLWTKLSDGIGRIVIAIDSGIVGDTYIKKEAQIVNDPYKDDRFLPSIDKKSGYKTNNILTVPIFNSRREVMGIIQLLNKSRGDFTKDDLDSITFFANYVSGSLELVLINEN